MKMVILAGGQKSTISDEPEGMPKPMLPIGGRPLLWHIMKHASSCGIKDFIICGGYKVETIKDYFLDFYIYQSDIRVDTGKNTVEILEKNTEDWNVTIVDTGIKSLPTERVRKILDIVDEDFLLSYGDCLSDISLDRFMELHEREGKDVTVAVARPTGRKIPLHFFEETDAEWGRSNETWTSAGLFMVKKKAILKVEHHGDIEDILNTVSASVYQHKGFFSTIETLRDKVAAEEMWEKGNASWMEAL